VNADEIDLKSFYFVEDERNSGRCVGVDRLLVVVVG